MTQNSTPSPAYDSYEQLRTRYERLLDISRELHTTQDFKSLLRQILRYATDLTHTEAASIILIDPETGELRFEATSASSSDSADETLESFVVPRDGSIAGWVVTHGEHVLVEDVHNDPRWFSEADTELDYQTHNMLVVPLKARDEIIGTVQVLNKIDDELWSDEDIETLQTFAGQAGIAILTSQLISAEIERQRLEKELTIAHGIQMSMLPDEAPAMAGWDVAAFYRSANEVGGDFYDFFELDKGHLGMVIADVSDKGVGAALFMAMSRTVLRATARMASGPAETIRQANSQIIIDSHDPGAFVTVFYAALDPATGMLRFANGGHNRPYIRRAATNHVEEITTRGMILGLFEGDDFVVGEKVIRLEAGDVALFYTDGVTDAMNTRREAFDTERLVEAMLGRPDESARETVKGIVSAVDRFVGSAPPADDLTLFVVKRIG